MFQWMRSISSRFGGLDSTNPQHQSFMRQLQKDVKAEQPLQKSLSSLNVTVLDLETSGFNADAGDKILSMGAIKIKHNQLVRDDAFYTLVHEPEAVSPEVSEVTGLTAEELEADGQSISEALEQFYQFAQADILVAHHASHERKFLQKYTYRTMGTNLQHRLLDTSFVFSIAAPDFEFRSLDDCCNYYDIPIKGRHNALGDAIMAAELWTRSIQTVQELGYETLQDVYAHLSHRRK